MRVWSTPPSVVGDFRYATLGASVNLISGSTYIIASQHNIAGGDNYGYYANVPVLAVFPPEVSYIEDRYDLSTSLIYPTTSDGFDGVTIFAYVSGNFLFIPTGNPPQNIPTLGEWGVILLVLFLLAISTILILQRERSIRIIAK